MLIYLDTQEVSTQPEVSCCEDGQQGLFYCMNVSIFAYIYYVIDIQLEKDSLFLVWTYRKALGITYTVEVDLRQSLREYLIPQGLSNTILRLLIYPFNIYLLTYPIPNCDF